MPLHWSIRLGCWQKRALAGVFAVLGLFGLLALSRHYSQLPSSSAGLSPTKPEPSFASLLNTDRVLARVDGAPIQGADLKSYFNLLNPELDGNLSLLEDEMAQRLAAALDELIADEILVREARKQGFQTSLQGAAGRRDLANQLVQSRVKQLPPVSDRELREFYGTHGEKFTEAPANRVRELFLPFRAEDRIKKRKGPTFDLANRLKAELSSPLAPSVEKLAGQYTPVQFRQKSKGYVFTGAVVDPAEERIVLTLPPGRLAGPFHVEGGLSIFQGVEFLRQRFITFYQAKETIQKYLESERLNSVRRQLLEDLSRRVKVEKYNPASLVAFRSSSYDHYLS
jgi:parvulin-like peptidyl-prolyl isomerase